MRPPEMIELNQVDFVTIDTIGPPGQRTFYLQAAQEDTIVTLIIEKEHAAAISVAITRVLERLEGTVDEPKPANMDLIQPVQPLFRVGKLELGYDEMRDMLVIRAEELGPEEQEDVAQGGGFKLHRRPHPRRSAATAGRRRSRFFRGGRPVQ